MLLSYYLTANYCNY